MRKRYSLKRPKAVFGSDGALMAAATLTAAGMTTAATAIAAKQQADATRRAADTQAKSINQQAQIQAKSVSEQIANNQETVDKQIENQQQTVESQNEIFRDMNMNLALAAGQQNAEQRKEQSKIVVKYGGNMNTRRKLRNMGVVLQDNSYLIPVGDGAFLLRGGSPTNPQDQTHSNSHKNTKRDGRNKGSYLKLNGEEIEAEAGGLNTTGEIIDPIRGIVLSQRNILPNGSSPVEEVLSGVPIDQAYAEQEYAKALLGLDNNDNSKAKYGYRKRLGARQERQFNNWWLKNAPAGTNPDDYVTDYRAAFAAGNPRYNRYKLKCGGRVKAANGFNYNFANDYLANPNYYNNDVNYSTYKGNNSSKGGGFGWGAAASLGGAALGLIGNFIGAGIQNSANNYAARILGDAYNQRANYLTDAYNKMHGVDIDSALNDFGNAAHAIANVRAGRFNINPQLVQNERNMLRQQRDINRTTLSGAARQSLLNAAILQRADADSRAYAEQANRVEAINQANISELNKTANENADRDTQMLTQRGNLKAQLLQYNNDIENDKLLGIANAQSDSVMGRAESNSNARISNAGNWGNAITGSVQGINNAITGIANRRFQLQSALLGSTAGARASYYANMSSKRDANIEYNNLLNQYYSTEDKEAKEELAKRINTIAAGRGWQFV